MHTKKLPPPPFLKKKDRTLLIALKREAEVFLSTAGKNDIFILQVLMGTKKVPAISSLLFILSKNDEEVVALMHKSPPKLVRDVATWLSALKPDLDWKESVCDRIEDAAVTVAKKIDIEPEKLVLSIEIGKTARVSEIIQERGTFMIRFN